MTNTLAYYDTELITVLKKLIVEAQFPGVGKLANNISQWKGLTVTNTLAYYDAELITTVKCLWWRPKFQE
jgi:hypothetical protein